MLCAPTAFANTESLEKLPEIALEFIDNEPDTKNRPILLEFWATWCPPCLANIPHLNEIHEKFSPKGLLIIGVTNEDISRVKKFSRDHKITYTIAIDKDNQMAKHFKVNRIPFAILADKSGKILWTGHPSQLTEEIISQAL